MKCPDGHESAATDYCDQCGMAMVGDAGASDGVGPTATPEVSMPAPAADAGGAEQPCPHCGAPNAPDALFCEACGYDHTTNTAPAPPEPNPLSLPGDEPPPPMPAPQPAPHPAAEQEPEPAAPEAHQSPDAPESAEVPESPEPAGPSEQDGPDLSALPEPATDPGQPGPQDAGGSGQPSDAAAPVLQPPAAPGSAAPAPDAMPSPDTGPDPEQTPAQPMPAVPAPGASDSPAPALDPPWVAEVWVDPQWYSSQQSPDPLPSAGLPQVVILRRTSLLIGRTSASRGITPDIECGTDNGVSRRHAQLTTDGARWWVEDLDSSNGTFVADAVGGVPTSAIPARQKREVDADDRIYVGSWTRIVIRPAAEGEA